MFQLTAARRRLGFIAGGLKMSSTFQLTAARRRLVRTRTCIDKIDTVSTHSRPKAAGSALIVSLPEVWRFNSQPPEGGWR